MSIALMLGAPVSAAADSPRLENPEDSAGRAIVGSPAGQEVETGSVPDQAAMVLAGSLLIGAAAAVRRAA